MYCDIRDSPYTKLEAMFSYTKDIDNNNNYSINGYAKLWQWSRNKVRKFLKEVRTPEGHLKDTSRTGQGQALHFINKDLWIQKDKAGTSKGQDKDTLKDSTINPNPNPNPKKENKKKYTKKNFVPPTLEEVRNYFKEKGYSVYAADKAFEYYSIANWHDSKGNKVKNWKQKMMVVWFKDENKVSIQENIFSRS